MQEYCTLDPISRKLTLTEPQRIAGVESDENARGLKFKFPKTVDNIDLTQMQVRINFANSRGEKGQHIITDLKPVEGEEGYITFTWPFSRLVTRHRGYTKFVICAVKTDENSTITAEWNTALAQMRVLEGLEVDEPEISPEEKDVISQLISICQNSADEAALSAQQTQEEAEKVLTYGPTIGEDGNWLVGGEDTGQPSQGFSPTVQTKPIDNGTEVVITDKNGEKSFEVKDGKDGEPGTPGKNGMTPTIGENSNWFLGEEDTGKSSRGEDGFSPDVKLSTIEGGVKVTITDKDRSESFDILDGDKVVLTSGDLFSPPPETIKLENTRVRNGTAETVEGWNTFHVPMNGLKTGMIVKSSPASGAYYGYYQRSDESYNYTQDNVLGTIFPNADKDGFYVSLKSETFPEFYINAKSGIIDKKPIQYKGFKGTPTCVTFSNRSLFCFEFTVPHGIYLVELPSLPISLLYESTGNRLWPISTAPVQSTNAPAQNIDGTIYLLIANISDSGFGLTFRASAADGIKNIQQICDKGFKLYTLSDYKELTYARSRLPIPAICHQANFAQDYMIAAALGWDGIELDVRKTIDNVYVLSHEASVGGKTIAETKYDELKSAVSYISTLEDCLCFIAPFGMHVDLHMSDLSEWERLQCIKSVKSHGIEPWYYTDIPGNIGTTVSREFCKTGIAVGVGVNPPTDTQYYGNYILWKEPDSQSQESMMNWMFINDGATDMGYDYLVNTDFKGATYFFGYRKSDKLLYTDTLTDTGI